MVVMGGRRVGPSQGNQTKPNHNKTCNYCHKKGFVKVVGWALQKKQSGGDGKPKKGKRPQITIKPIYVDFNSDSGVLVVTYGKNCKSKNELIMDSGFSFHMTHNRDLQLI